MPNTVTIHECVFANHRKEDGTYNVKIRVTFNRQNRKLPTNIFVTSQQLTKDLKIKDPNVMDAIYELKKQMRQAIESINLFALESMDIDQVVTEMKKLMNKDKPFQLDFFCFASEVIKDKPKKSGANYLCAVNALKEFSGSESMDISDITSSMMRNFESWLKRRYGAKARAVSLYTSGIAHIHKLARMRYNNEELGEIRIRDPFQFYKPPKQTAAQHRATTVEVLRMMAQERRQLEGREYIGVSLFLLSFGLMGANTPDIYDMRRTTNGILVYNRTKTRSRRADNAEMRIRIEKEIKSIVEDLSNKCGDYQFIFRNRYSMYETLGTAANIGLRQWSDKHRIRPALTVYSARHAWPTIAYSIGINPAIITDALNHVDEGRRMDFIYTVKDWKILWNANKKVLSYVFPEE